MALVYPATLPGPLSAGVANDERRLIAVEAGVAQTGVIQRDRLAVQQLVFIFTFAQAALFRAWWTTDLVYGGAWFVATWPLPEGWLPSVRKFLQMPRWEYLGRMGWRVTAEVEIRGRTLNPAQHQCFAGMWADISDPPQTIKDYANLAGGNGLFVGLNTAGTTAIVYTVATSAWSTSALPTAPYSGGFNGVTFANGIFVTARQGSIATSPDGVAWTNYTYSGNNAVSKFAFDSGGWLSVNNNSFSPIRITASASNTDWSFPTGGGYSGFTFEQIVSNGAGRHIAVGGAPDYVLYSDDRAVTWTASASLGSGSIGRSSGCFFGGRFITNKSAGIISSVNGASGWALDVSIGGGYSAYEMQFARSDCAAVALTGTAYTASSGYYTFDGVAWTLMTMPSARNWTNLAYDSVSKKFMATTATGQAALGA